MLSEGVGPALLLHEGDRLFHEPGQREVHALAVPVVERESAGQLLEAGSGDCLVGLEEHLQALFEFGEGRVDAKLQKSVEKNQGGF